jgi:S1-C subfamily serine protease
MSEAQQAAALLWRQYGEDALVIAVLRAAEVAALGDADALAHWDEVAAILEGGGAPGEVS